MQAVLIASIGALAVIMSSLMSVGSSRLRALKKIKEEAEAFGAIPEDLVQERQLARYALNHSLWEYAASRRSASLVPYFLAGITGAFAIPTGFWMVLYGRLPDLESSLDEPNWRFLGAALFVLGVRFYIGALMGRSSAIRRQAARIGGPPDRERQLIALEANALEADTTLEDVPIGVPADDPATLKEALIAIRPGKGVWSAGMDSFLQSWDDRKRQPHHPDAS